MGLMEYVNLQCINTWSIVFASSTHKEHVVILPIIV